MSKKVVVRKLIAEVEVVCGYTNGPHNFPDCDDCKRCLGCVYSIKHFIKIVREEIVRVK